MASFYNYLKTAVCGIFFLVALLACEEELITIGDTVIGGEPFTTDKAYFDVFVYNKDLKAVPTNKLPIYQLGVYNDPVFGNTEARITTQVTLPSGQGNPIFGIFSQATEDNADTDEQEATIDENETVQKVYLYIPYLQNPSDDRDQDGVIDSEDMDPEDPNSDTDNDGLSDNEERIRGTNPLVADTDGDGINDAEDPETALNIFPRKKDLDSIYGNREASFVLKVERSTFFLRDLDPNANFLAAQEYYSTQQFSPDFTEEVLFEGAVTISDDEILIPQEDDPETEEDESEQPAERLQPGIRVELDPLFFQQNILDNEGRSPLLSASNFVEFFRGIHLSASFPTDNLLFLLDLTNANITIEYEYDKIEEGETVKEARSYELSLITGGGNQGILGNAVNTLNNEALPMGIADELDTGENASRIYLKGGEGTYAQIVLFGEDGGESIIEAIKANNWIINEAKLTFYLDEEALIPAPALEQPVRLYVFNAENNQPLYDPLNENSVAESNFGLFLNYDGFLETDSNGDRKYEVRITDHINDILIRDAENDTLGLMVTSDIRIIGAQNTVLANGEERDLPISGTISPLSTVLIGSNVPVQNPKRLQLEISYTETN